MPDDTDRTKRPGDAWVRAPHPTHALLVNVRAVHFTSREAFATMIRALCPLDRDGLLAVSSRLGSTTWTAMQAETAAADLAGATSARLVLTLAGDALHAGAWSVRVSANPAQPGQIRTSVDHEAFGHALAGIVATYTRSSTLPDLKNGQSLVPS